MAVNLLAADILYLLTITARAWTAAAARETIGAFAALMRAGFDAVAVRLRAASDERGQAINVTAIVAVLDHRLRLILRLRALMVAVVIAMLLTRLVRLLGALLAGRIGLLRLLLRSEAGLLPEVRIAVRLALVLRLPGVARLIRTRLLLILPELFLCGSDQTEIVFGVLIVILGGDRIARRARIARELHILLGNMRGCAADLDIRAVRIEHPGHRVLAAPVIVVVGIVIPVIPHPLVILTVSHVLPF